jgi:V/A-type H+-transporting ATPase subunit E
MELQIQDLVESIKRDGIAEADKRAAQIISEAKEKADEMVRNGAKEAERLVEEARKEVAVMRQSGKAAVEQAGRDVILSLKKNIYAHFDRLLESTVKKSLSGKDLVTLITSVVKSGLAEVDQSRVEVPQKLSTDLVQSLRGDLADELKKGLEIRPVPSVDVGFKIAAKDGSSYYDFSSEEITGMLAPFLNSTVREILNSDSER